MADTEDSREKALAAKREWMRAWRAANREKARERNRAWYNANCKKERRVVDPKKQREKRNAQERERRAANREEHNAKQRALHAVNREADNAKKRERRARDPMLTAYSRQKSQAINRNVEFLLTFEEWTAIWSDSGKWEQRGRRRGQYVMARYADVGPYAVGNVRICTGRENNSEQIRRFTAETRARMAESQRGKTHTPETRQRLSELAKAQQARARALRHGSNFL